jgi:hypothetical protein
MSVAASLAMSMEKRAFRARVGQVTLMMSAGCSC